MLKRFLEPSTWAGIGVTAIAAYQSTGDWRFSVAAIFSAIGAVFLPEGRK